MTDTKTRLADLYREKQEQGLIDVKFLIQNREEASETEAFAELLALNEAIKNGEARPLDFGDLAWKD